MSEDNQKKRIFWNPWVKTFVSVLLIAIAAFGAGLHANIQYIEEKTAFECNQYWHEHLGLLSTEIQLNQAFVINQTNLSAGYVAGWSK